MTTSLDDLIAEADTLIQATAAREAQLASAPPTPPVTASPTPETPSIPTATPPVVAETPTSPSGGPIVVGQELLAELRGLRQGIDRLIHVLEAKGPPVAPRAPAPRQAAPAQSPTGRAAALPATAEQKAQWAAEGLPVLEAPQGGTTEVARGLIVGEDGIPDLDFHIPSRRTA